MKKIFYPILAAAAILTACNEEVITDGTGSLSFRIGEVADQYNTKADAVNTYEFFVTLSDWNGNAVTSGGVTYSNVPYKNIPSEIDGLPSGPYTVTVSSHVDAPAAAFDTPVYGGQTAFNVKTGATTPVKVKCSVQNVKVTINPTAAFLSELTTYTVTVKNEHGGTIHWTNSAELSGSNVTSDLDLPAYFSVSALDVNVTGYRKVSGAEVNLEENAEWNGKITDVAAADHHIINIDAKTTGGIGGTEEGKNGITLIVDGSELNEVNTELNVPGYEDVGVDGPDRGENEDSGEAGVQGLELIWPGNETFARTELKETMDVNLSIRADNGIKEFVVYVNSPSASFISAVAAMGAPGETVNDAVLDFSTQKVVDGMIAIALITESPIGQTEVAFPLSGLLPLIIQVGNPDPDSVHTFTMYLKDNNDQELSIPLEFVYQPATPLE